MRKYCLIGIPVVLVILEALPFGVVAYFADGPDQVIQKTFSYFDLIPVGYANVGPFITAVLSCFLLFTAILYVLLQKETLRKIIRVCSAVAFVTSLLPLLFGFEWFTILGCVISGLLAVEFVICRSRTRV